MRNAGNPRWPDGTQIAIMNSARARNAARKVPALVAIALVLPLGGTAEAGGEPQLTLPLVAALSLATSVAGLGRPADAAGGRGGLLGFLPRRIQIPDLYAVEVERDPAPYALGIDNDRLVAFDFLSGERPGVSWSAAVAYDEESRGPLARSNNLLHFIVELRF